MARGGVIESSLPKGGDPADDDLRYAPDPVDDEPAPEDEPQPIAELTAEELRQQEVEAEARRQGWKPLAEYRGPAGGWRSAEEYVRRGREIAGIQSERLRKSEQQVERLTGEVAQMRTLLEEATATIKTLNTSISKADRAGYERAIKELKAQRDTAAQNNDLSTYNEISERITEAEEAARTVEAASAPRPEVARPDPKPQPSTDSFRPEIQEFLDANGWFWGPNADPVLHTVMRAEHEKIMAQSPGLDLREALKRAKDRVIAEYPEKFGLDPKDVRQPRTPARSPVGAPSGGANGGRVPAGRPTGLDVIEDQAERAAAKDAYRRYLQNDPDCSEEEYLELYNDPKVDVLELRRKYRRAQPQPPRRAPNARRQA